MAVARQALADDLAREHVQRGEQRRGAIALVVVGHRAGAAPLDRQRGLGAIERLDLGLLIHAQHDCLLGRIEVETDDVDELLLKRLSFDSLNVLTRCGFRPLADQISWTVAGLTPWALAIVRQLQCVSPSGFS